ncbi:hypothetical protein, partial [Streptomyces cyaneofuscatus]|uniref:hypothetical protein n=1 Tax=Streptomyces cyaneofuscatus TaxID=66883 RepID=UPI003A91B8BB
HHGVAGRIAAGGTARDGGWRRAPLPLKGLDGTPGLLAGLPVGPPQLMDDKKQENNTKGDDDLGGAPEPTREKVPPSTTGPRARPARHGTTYRTT